MRNPDGSKALILGYQQSSDEAVRLAVERYTEGCIVSPHHTSADNSSSDPAYLDSDSSDFDPEENESEHSEVW